MHEAKRMYICCMLFFYLFLRKEDKKVLNLVLKTGDRIQIGDNVIIKLQSDSRAQLAIDAPKEVNIKRIASDKEESPKLELKSGVASSRSGKKNIIVVNNK